MRWTLYFNRAGFPITLASLIFPWYRFSFIKQRRGLNIGNNYIRLDKKGDVYFVKKEFEVSGQRLLKFVINNLAKTEKLLKKCFQEGDSFIKFANKISAQKPELLNEKEILKIWRNFRKKARDVGFWMVLPQTVDKHLEDYLRRKIIRSRIKKYHLKINEDDAISIIIKPQKKIFAEKENQDFLKLIRWIKKSKYSLRNSKLQTRIKRHLFLYSWIKARWWRGESTTAKELINRIRKKLARVTPLLKELKNKDKLARKEFNLLAKKLKFSVDEKLLIKIVQEIVFIRTYRTDILNLAGYRFRKFFEFLAKKFNLTYEDFINLTADEIEKIIKEWKASSTIKREIEKRKKAFFVYQVIRGREKITYSTVAEREELFVREIKGRAAYLGKVKGEAKIVLNKSHFIKVKRGDILITTMTTPDFISVMERAIAFVTDEGGITCHAAIISRELKKPCIIGTKIATKVLKDGDLVEVDADKGVVKILKNKNII